MFNHAQLTEEQLINLHKKLNDISMRLNRINGSLIKHEGDPVVDALVNESNEIRERITNLKKLLVILDDEVNHG